MLRGLALAGALALIAGSAAAAPAGVWGAGAQSCANWTEARGGDTAWRDYFEGWATGFLSDANVRRYGVHDPNPAVGDLLHGKQPAAFFRDIDQVCAGEPKLLLAAAVVRVVDKLVQVEDLQAAVRH